MSSISTLNEEEIKKGQLRRVFKLPQLNTLFKVKRNPFDSLAINEEWIREAFEYSLLDKKALTKIKGIQSFAAYFYPLCNDIKRYENIVKVMFGFLFFDDHIACGYGDAAGSGAKAKVICDQVLAACQKLLDRDHFVSMNGWKPYITWWYMAMDGICNGVGVQTKKRMIECYQDTCRAILEECVKIESGYVYKDLEEMFVIRRDSIAMNSSFALLGYAANIELTDEEWDRPLFQQLRKALIEIVICDNDIQSFEKEWLDDNKDLTRMFNVVARTAILDKCPIKEAMDKIAAQSFRLQEMAIDLMNQLNELDIREEMKTYVDLMQYMPSGYFMVGTFLDRYVKLSD